MDSMTLFMMLEKRAQTYHTLEAFQTVSDALNLFLAHDISSVVILDEDHRPIGIFTENDTLGMVIDQLPTQTVVRDVMSRTIFSVQSSLFVYEAYAMLDQTDYHHLIIVDQEDRFLGIVTEGDLMRTMQFDEVAKGHSVTSAMSKMPLMVEPDAKLFETVALLREHRRNYAIVCRQKHPLGIVHQRSIAHYLHDNRIEAETTIEPIVSEKIHTVLPSISLFDAIKVLEQHGVHQLIVMDEEENHVIGALNRDDVFGTIQAAYHAFLLKSMMGDTPTKVLEQKRQELDEVQSLAHIGSWVLDARTNHFSGSLEAKRIYGFDDDALFDYATVIRRNHPDDLPLIEAEFAKAFSTGEYLLTHRLLINNKVRWVYAMAKGVRDEEGNVYKLEGFIQDITKLKEHETDMEALKNLDHLTGLPNRIILLDHLKTLLEQSHQNGKMIALMFFDLDRFKDINDSFGHDVGDELLLQMAQRLIEHLGGEHFIARLGSDEFALVMEDVHKEEYVAHVAQSVIEMLSEPYTIDELTIHSGASAGLVIAPTYAQSVQEMLQHADAALHKAKDEGRQTYRFYSEVLTNLAKQRVACENRLRRALKEGEFELYYQPQVHLKTGRVIGAEALIRWNDPDEGFVSPATFIPIAEAQGLIGHIGEWVLLTACMQGAKWHQQGHSLHLSVNISAHQIHQQNFLQVVDKVLKVSRFRPDKLTLELTESTMMDREEEIAQLLHSLRAKGIYLAIDDFGTGYSSYSYLKRFPINVLKIDKSFIDDVPYNNDDTAIVKAIVAMGKVLGFQLLAEGTEHREQLDFLEDQGCDMYQGYYKSKPLPVREFEALLENN